MVNFLKFNISYLTFTSNAQPFLRADDVGYAITEFMWFKGKPYYPMGALTEARIACLHLSSAFRDEFDEDNLDLVFLMRRPEGGHFFEVVLRSNHGTTYGGWLWGSNLEIVDEMVEGYHVLSTIHDGEPARFEFSRELGQYKFVGDQPVDKTPPAEDRDESFYHGIARIEIERQ
jgi:hypothetical protein